MRHALTRVALVSCVLALAAATGPAGAAGADSTLKPTSRQQANWTKFHFNLGNTGFNPFENVINTSNVSSLVSAWQGVTGTSSTSSPAVVHGVVYVGMDDNKLYAFDAAGVTNCSGTPKTCKPLWTGATGFSIRSSPAVVRGVVYVGSSDGKLYAFDAAGVTNCSGTPKTCAPLWTGATGSSIGFSSPAVANGVVYIGADDGKLYAFDAAGNTNCSGTPKTCQPLWTGATGYFIESSPALAGGVVYIGSYDGKLYAFDAAGNTNCSGTPKTCQPLWTAPTGTTVYSPAVAQGIVYAGAGHKLYAFDAAGNTNCSGTPKVCTPLWTGAPGFRCVCSVSVAGGLVYAGSARYTSGNLYAFDASGVTNCSGTPKTCTPLWTGPTGRNYLNSAAAVVNGVVYVASGYANLRVFALP